MATTEAEVRTDVQKVMHPAINLSLLDLGIVKDVSVKSNEIRLTMAFPFPNIPIGDQLINSVKEAVKKFGAEIHVQVTLMNQAELQRFLDLEHQNWIG